MLALAVCAPAQAQFWRSTGLPDAVEFGMRIEMGDFAQAKAWLDRGLDPDFVGDRIGTGLMIAAWEGNVPMMELFVSRGADIHKTNNVGEQAILHAAWKGRLEAVKWLLDRGAKLDREPRQWTPLHYAAFSGHTEVVDLLVERGADINARSTNGSTPLMMAVYEGREAMVGQLLRLGADRNLRNDYDEGAMDWAFKYNHLAIARMVGSAEEFATAANRPKAYWPKATQSLPVTATSPEAQAKAAPQKDPGAEMRAQIADLMRARAELAANGLNKDVQLVDRKIATLRYKLAKPGEDYRRRPAVLEISASRKSPRDQKARLIVQPAAGKKAAAAKK